MYDHQRSPRCMNQLPTLRYHMAAPLLLSMIVTFMSLLTGACNPETQGRSPAEYVVTVPGQTGPGELDATAAAPRATVPNPTVFHTLAAKNQQCAVECEQTPLQYQVGAVLDWQAHTVGVVEYVTFRNEGDDALDEIVFNVETNREAGIFTLNKIMLSSGDSLTGYMLVGSRLVVPLLSPLRSECEITLTLNYTLQIPPIGNGYREGHVGYWGYSARQVNLGMWLPLIAAADDRQNWATPEPHWLGEHFVLRAADFVVELKVTNAPDNLRVAGPGRVSQVADRIWRFEIANAREVALSLSDHFDALYTSTASGVEVDLFYFPDPDAGTLDTPRHALHTAVDAMMLYEELFGAYPYERLVVVEGDFPDGMEFTGLVFVSRDWFNAWRGDPNDWLTIITAHEVAHQWWYARVGNDQAHYPYLDEALAMYCELLFFERYYPELLDWWWEFRVMKYEPTGYVDTPIYEFYSARGYIDAVYLRGAQMMHGLRTDLGAERFFAWLRTYVGYMAGEIAAPADFWGLLPSDSYTRTKLTRVRYLQQPDVLPPPDVIP